MMEALYQCPECGQPYESLARGDRLDACRVEGCTGQPKRVWSFSFARSSARAVPK